MKCSQLSSYNSAGAETRWRFALLGAAARWICLLDGLREAVMDEIHGWPRAAQETIAGRWVSHTGVYSVGCRGKKDFSCFMKEKGTFKKFFYPQQMYIFCINIHVWRHNTRHGPHTNYQPHGPQPSVWALQGVDMTGQNTSRMFTEMRGDVSSNSRMCQTYVTCTLLPTKNKSLVLCHPIVLAPVFVFILPRYKNFVLYCSSFIPAQLLCYRTQRTTTTTSQSHILLVKKKVNMEETSKHFHKCRDSPVLCQWRELPNVCFTDTNYIM